MRQCHSRHELTFLSRGDTHASNQNRDIRHNLCHTPTYAVDCYLFCTCLLLVLVFACFYRHGSGDCQELFLECTLHCKPWPWQVLLSAIPSLYIMVPLIPAMLDTYLHMQLVGHEQLAPVCNSSDGSSRQQLQLICNLVIAPHTQAITKQMSHHNQFEMTILLHFHFAAAIRKVPYFRLVFELQALLPSMQKAVESDIAVFVLRSYTLNSHCL